MIRTHAAVLLGSLIVSFLLYGNSIPGVFVYDDVSYINREDVKRVENLWKVWSQPLIPNAVNAGLFHPLTSFTFTLSFVAFGESPVSFHVVNIILHGIASFLVFLVATKLWKNTIVALCIGLLFMFLPIHSETVANIKGRDELLAALFGLAAWLTFLRATEGGKRIDYPRMCLSALIFLLAVLSKALIITLPALYVLTFIVRKKPTYGEIAKIAGIFFVVVSVYLYWRYRVLGEYAFGKDVLFYAINPLATAPFWTRIFTAFTIAFIYIVKTYIPWNLSASYHFNQVPMVTSFVGSWQVMGGLTVLATLILLATVKKTRTTPIGLGALAFLVPYIVISKLLFKGGDIMAERWMYTPSVGLSIIGGFLIYTIVQKQKKLGVLLFICMISAYAWVVVSRNLVWRTEESLRRSMVTSAPNSIQGHYGLAQYYLENTRLEEAKKEAMIGYKIYDRHPPLLNTLGSIAYLEKDFDRSEMYYLQAIEEAPFVTQGYQNAAKLYFTIGKYDKAESLLRYLITKWSHPRSADFIDYALVLAKLGRYKESLGIITRKFSGEYHDSRIRLILAIDYYKIGNMEEVKKYFDWNTTLSDQEKVTILKNF